MAVSFITLKITGRFICRFETKRAEPADDAILRKQRFSSVVKAQGGRRCGEGVIALIANLWLRTVPEKMACGEERA
jgi:hypothetical protein